MVRQASAFLVVAVPFIAPGAARSATTAPPFADGYEAGDPLASSATVP